MNQKAKDYNPPNEDEIACCAFVIFARQKPDLAQQLWREAETQLVASRKHDAGMLRKKSLVAQAA